MNELMPINLPSTLTSAAAAVARIDGGVGLDVGERLSSLIWRAGELTTPMDTEFCDPGDCLPLHQVRFGGAHRNHRRERFEARALDADETRSVPRSCR